MQSPFVSALVEQTKKQYNEKGAVEFTAEGVKSEKARDIEGYLTAAFSGILRGTTDNKIEEFTKQIFQCKDATREDLEDFVAMIFHTRDCRGDGKGERQVFYSLIWHLYHYVPKTTLELLKLVPEYGYWKDFQNMVQLCFTNRVEQTEMIHDEKDIKNTIYEIWIEQLKHDVKQLNSTTETTPTISLAAKYFPKEGKSLDKRFKITQQVARLYFNDTTSTVPTILKRFRKEVISPLTKAINVTERYMCNNEWSQIKFNLVPSKCLNNYRKAFLNITKTNQPRYLNNEERNQCKMNLEKHIKLAEKGLTKIHGKQLFLHEITNKYNTRIGRISTEEKQILQLQWNEHKKIYEELVQNNSGLERTMVLADFSGSMTGTPMDVAAALALMISSLAPEPWRNKFISFETKPQVLDIPDKTLEEKMRYVMNSPWGGSTDFLAAIQLILDIGIKNKLNEDEMPKKLIIVSDMQFDRADSNQDNYYSHQKTSYEQLNKYTNNGFRSSPSIKKETTHQLIQQAFFNAGMEVSGSPWTPPTMVYWNVRDTSGYPVQSHTPNTQMLSGFSISLLKLILNNKELTNNYQPTPYETFIEAVRGENEHYEPVRKAIAKVSEEPYFKNAAFGEWEEI